MDPHLERRDRRSSPHPWSGVSWQIPAKQKQLVRPFEAREHVRHQHEALRIVGDQHRYLRGVSANGLPFAIDHGADVEPVADWRAVECRVWRENVSPDRIGEKTNAAVQSQARLPDEMPSGEVITMGIMRPSDGKCARVDRASDVCMAAAARCASVPLLGTNRSGRRRKVRFSPTAPSAERAARVSPSRRSRSLSGG